MTEDLEPLKQATGRAPPPGALDALARAAREELARTPTPRRWWVDALLVLGLNVVMGLGAAAMMSSSDTQHASTAMKYGVATAWLVVMALGSAWWLKPGRVDFRWAVAALFVGASVLSVGNASGFDPGSPFFAGLKCALVECGVAVVPISVVVLLSLRFAARASHLFSGALASAAGATLALHFHCGNGTLGHLLTFHLLPAVGLAGAAVLVRRWLPTKSHVP